MPDFVSRKEVNEHAARSVLRWIESLDVSRRGFAEIVSMSPSTLALFLRDCSSYGTGHARGPRYRTMKPLLDCEIPASVREAILDAIYYEDRVLKPALMRTVKVKQQNSVQNHALIEVQFFQQDL